MNLTVPILPKKGLGEFNISPGNWVESNATMTIKIETRHKLFREEDFGSKTVQSRPGSNSKSLGTFSRLILVCGINDQASKLVESFITTLNKTVLNVGDFYDKYSLSPDQRKSKDLDICTGYRVTDGEFQIYFVEGIKTTIEKLSVSLKAIKTAAFYEISTNFPSRIWMRLVPGLVNVSLETRINTLKLACKTYRREINRECLDCFNILVEIVDAQTSSDKLISDYERKLINNSGSRFPTILMFEALFRQFGTLEHKIVEFKSPDNKVSLSANAKEPSLLIESSNPVKMSAATTASIQITTENENKKLKTKDEIKIEPNFVNRYVKLYPSIKTYRPRSGSLRIFNYSTQEESSTKLQLKNLRKEMNKDVSTTIAFGEEYLGQQIERVDLEEERRRERLIHSLNKSENGFWAGPFAAKVKGF